MFRLLGAAVLLIFAAGLVWGRCVLSEGRHAEALSAGASALDAALGGDETAWERAEAAYGQAARASLLDAYPLWVLELIRVWRGERSAVDFGPLSAVLEAIQARDYTAAALAAARLVEPTAREYAGRLVGDLRSAESGRTTAPLNPK